MKKGYSVFLLSDTKKQDIKIIMKEGKQNDHHKKDNLQKAGYKMDN